MRNITVFWHITVRTLEQRSAKSRLIDCLKKEGMKEYKDRKESQTDKKEEIKERMD